MIKYNIKLKVCKNIYIKLNYKLINKNQFRQNYRNNFI